MSLIVLKFQYQKLLRWALLCLSILKIALNVEVKIVLCNENMMFQPNYHNILDVLKNRRPARLPLYEHIISPEVMEKIFDNSFAELQGGNEKDILEFFTHYCRFFKEMTYDTVSFEVCITEILPGGGAIMGGKPGPIQNRNDFKKYPWKELSVRYWDKAMKQFEALSRCLPEGMKAIGGVGNGVFEISEDLIGYEQLCYMQIDDSELLSDIYENR